MAEEIIKLPHSVDPYVIGGRADTWKQIMVKSGAMVSFQSTNEVGDSLYREFTVKGTQHQINQARRLILRVLHEVNNSTMSSVRLTRSDDAFEEKDNADLDILPDAPENYVINADAPAGYEHVDWRPRSRDEVIAALRTQVGLTGQQTDQAPPNAWA